VYAFTLPGSLATHTLVLSEDDWNDWANDCVVVPIYPMRAIKAAPPLRITTQWGIADCTRIFSTPNARLNGPVASVPGAVLASIRSGVRSFLCVDALLATAPATAPATGRWYPQWTHVYYSNIPVNGRRKMHAVLSDNGWNSQMAYVSAARLTSKSKGSRLRWEVAVQGGPVVVGDLHVFAKTDLVASPPRPPRPDRLTRIEMHDMGHALERLLTL
jgi:mRNA-degrading endonuclease toxin of MazEF toxin-antitoxin module